LIKLSKINYEGHEAHEEFLKEIYMVIICKDAINRVSSISISLFFSISLRVLRELRGKKNRLLIMNE